MNLTDTLEIKIAKARELLSQDSRDAIDAVDWKQILLGMNNKFNSEQIENLETETELLLCGLVNTTDYPKELEARMKIPEVEVSSLLDEMNRLIFKKMQEELEKRLDKNIAKNKNILKVDKNLNLDSRFSNMPRDVQEAIAVSGWKEKIYQIAKKYNLSVEKMGILEDITVKTLSGSTLSEQYENEVRNKVSLPEDKNKEMIAEINESIFKQIKDFMRNNSTIGEKTVHGVPLPPYVVEKKESILPPLPPQERTEGISRTKSDIDIYREHGIEIISSEDNIKPEIKKEEIIKKEGPTPIVINNIEDIPSPNSISDKLFNKTASQATVNNYSLPKTDKPVEMEGSIPSNPHDPYHEII